MWRQQHRRWKGSEAVTGISVLWRWNSRHARRPRYKVGSGGPAERNGTTSTPWSSRTCFIYILITKYNTWSQYQYLFKISLWYENIAHHHDTKRDSLCTKEYTGTLIPFPHSNTNAFLHNLVVTLYVLLEGFFITWIHNWKRK